MGLFDFLGKKKTDSPPRASEREIQRLERLVGNKLSQNLDRQEAIDTLSKFGTAASATALLKRFDWVLDPTITDAEEKDVALLGVVRAGEEAIEPIRKYCKKAESLTWALKALAQIVPADRLADELLTLLDQFDTEYIRNAEPKIQLITELSHQSNDEVREALEPFLLDASEPVRFAAATSLFTIGLPESVGPLAAALAGEESLRIKNRIALGLSERRWSVPEDAREGARAALPGEYALSNGLVVRRG